MAIIGRQPPADIVIAQPNVSARHAEINHLGGGLYVLTDLGSLNGTYVNDRRIDAVVLSAEDRVRVATHDVDLWSYRAEIAPFLPAPPPIQAGERVLSVVRHDRDLTLLTNQRLLKAGDRTVEIPIREVKNARFRKSPYTIWGALAAACVVGATVAGVPAIVAAPIAALVAGGTSWLSSVDASLEITTANGYKLGISFGLGGGDRLRADRFLTALHGLLEGSQ